MSHTHVVTNQPPPRVGFDAFEEDTALREAVDILGPEWANDELGDLGRLVGDEEWIEAGRLANEHPPELRTHDEHGHRIDAVRYDPAYHRLMSEAVSRGLHAAPWADDRDGAHVVRAAKYVLWPRIDSGTLCPLTMTYAAVPSLRLQPDLAGSWEPRLTVGAYDPSFAPAEGKRGATFGMAMTEKQGGSDVRANTTTARPVGDGGPGGEYRLTGHKWFCSAPMSDGFLALAQTGGGDRPSCFLVPRWLPDGSTNVFRIQRLKDKLGDRSNASAEVEFEDTAGWMVGEEHRGVSVIMGMVAATRMDCVAGAAGWMQFGLDRAAWHAAHRTAFGRLLAEQPLMRNVLADLALEGEAAVLLALRLASGLDRSSDDSAEAALLRLATPIAKYWVCKRAPAHAAEALECLGGNGYVEESGMPRLFRQSPLNSLWEGSGNVQCLDVLRAIRTHPESVEALRGELETATGVHAAFDVAAKELVARVEHAEETGARRMTEDAAVLLQASLLIRYAPPAVSDAFVASRVAERHHGGFGTLPGAVDIDALVLRTPAVR